MSHETTKKSKLTLKEKIACWRIISHLNKKSLIFLAPIMLWALWCFASGFAEMLSTTKWPTITPSVQAEIDSVLRHPAFGNPEASAASKRDLEDRKGRALLLAIVARMEVELEDGWTPQYLAISPRAHFDNAINRKLGVLMATTELQKFFSVTMGKYGNMDPENPWLQKARERDFTYGPRVWGLFKRSSVSAYESGIANVHRFADHLVLEYAPEDRRDDTRVIVNIKANEVYEMLMKILSKDVIDVPLGWLSEPGENLSFRELDDKVYYALGVSMVLRDVLAVLQQLYPEKITNEDKGGTVNLTKAMEALDKICVFDPLIVLRGNGDSMFADHRGKVARYMFTVRERLLDVAETIRR